jgi:lipopolysaccharide/colanic/teichoic acid biosynthesis glycosyltransferase
MPILITKKSRRKRHREPVPSDWKIPRANDLVPSPYFRWKGVIGWVLALILLLPGLPIIGILVLLVRLTSKGPGIHRQTRIGKDGKPFTMYKIRTMAHDTEAQIGVVWTRPGDARITHLGRVLRKLHLDELPQLFNVLKGEMHLIGPRPERPEFVHALAKVVPGYTNRLAVRPGITGLAQINLPPDTDLESVRCKLALDLEYVGSAGPVLDIRMFLCTCVRLLGLPGEYSMRMFQLQRDVTNHPGHSIGPSNGASGADHSFVTPAHIVAQATVNRPDGNGGTPKESETPSHDESERKTAAKPR